MSNRRKGWVFTLAFAAASILLFALSGGAWSRSGVHLALDTNVRRSGAPNPLPVSTQTGWTRETLPDPGDHILNSVRLGDAVHVKARWIPLLGEEWLHCALVREGREIASWSDGGAYYATALAVGALAIAAAVTAAAALIGAVFRFQPLGTED